MPDSILFAAGTGPVIPQDPGDWIAASQAAVHRAAAGGDWRAAAWLLERHPSTREAFGDPSIREAITRQTLARVVAGVAAAELPPESERRALLGIASRCGALPEGGEG
jgi:hypothetical protein